MALPRHNATHYASNSGSNGNAYRGHNDSGYSISPYSTKFNPRNNSAAIRRRKTFQRLGLLVVGITILGLFVSSTLRQSILPGVGLGWLAGTNAGTFATSATIEYYDLSMYNGSPKGWENSERILFLAPFRDAEVHLPMFFSHLKNITYPHHLIDLAFLVSDSKDRTLPLLTELLEKLQKDPDPAQWFGEISVLEKDFGQAIGQDFSNRHGFAAQGPRRKLMARARNWLLNASLKPHHSWVYWRDADVETAPPTILEDLMRHNKDVIVPNVWRPLPDWLGGEQPYDLNSWQESETGLELAKGLDEDAVIVEGYAEYATWRPHLAYLRDPYGDPDMEMEIDGIGGVSILAKARVFRQGCHFPAFSFEKHAETEGFGKMAKRMGYSVIGLPHYTIWHLYEPSADDLKHMQEMEQQRLDREKSEKEKAERERVLKEGYEVKKETWDKDQKDIIDAALNEQLLKQQKIADAENKLKKLKSELEPTITEPPLPTSLAAPMVAPGVRIPQTTGKPNAPQVQMPGVDKVKEPPTIDKDGKQVFQEAAAAGIIPSPGVIPPSHVDVDSSGKTIPRKHKVPELKGGSEGPIAHVGEPGVGGAGDKDAPANENGIDDARLHPRQVAK